MNFVPYPRVDKNDHVDLDSWRNLVPKTDGTWRKLKIYLSENCRLAEVHPLTKCWFTELHQGDNYALDVEHFRPKNLANPLSKDLTLEIEKILGFRLLQDLKKGGKYPWLEFDYRNYRIVTALTNRAGGKHVNFPIFRNTTRLKTGNYPWDVREYPILLDPVDKHDASQLIVKPDGEIAPASMPTTLTQQHIDVLPLGWTEDHFNYTRAIVTIRVYRLDDTIFQQGRKETFEKIKEELDILLIAINLGSKDIIEISLKRIATAIMPSAQFSLASKCSLISYIPDKKFDDNTVNVFELVRKKLLLSLESQIDACVTNWNNP